MNTRKQMIQDGKRDKAVIDALIPKLNHYLSLGMLVTCNGVRILKVRAMQTYIGAVPFEKNTHRKFIMCSPYADFRAGDQQTLINR